MRRVAVKHTQSSAGICSLAPATSPSGRHGAMIVIGVNNVPDDVSDARVVTRINQTCIHPPRDEVDWAEIAEAKAGDIIRAKTISEIAAARGIPVSTLRLWCARGWLQSARRSGAVWLVDEAEVAAFTPPKRGQRKKS